MADPSGLWVLLCSGGVLAFIGTLLTTRSGRQRDFDARQDAALREADAENDRLEARIHQVEGEKRAVDVENRWLQLENARLTRVCIDNRIDPGTSIPRPRGAP